MRNYIDLVEKTFVTKTPFDESVRVWENPVESLLKSLIGQFNELRGISSGGSFWVWDAEVATHNLMCRGLGIDSDNMIAFIITRSSRQSRQAVWRYGPSYQGGMMTLWCDAYEELSPQLITMFNKANEIID